MGHGYNKGKRGHGYSEGKEGHGYMDERRDMAILREGSTWL